MCFKCRESDETWRIKLKKICFLHYDLPRGGVGQVTISLAEEFCKFYEVHIIVVCPGDTISYEYNPNIHMVTLLEKRVSLKQATWLSRKSLGEYIRRHNMDIVIMQTWYAGVIGSTLRINSNAKLIYCDHCSIIAQRHISTTNMVAAMISACFAHKVILLNERIKDAYQKKFHLSSNKMEVLPNWIDIRQYHSANYNKESKKIISAGRFSQEKGFDRLLRAFRLAIDKYSDWRLDLYGDGDLIEELRNQAAELGLQNNISFMGMRKDLRNLYGEYAFFVLPSYREGMPLVLLEAKLNKLPAVCFDILTGPREIIKDGKDGFLVPQDDIEGLADAMCKLMGNEDLRLEMSNHTWDNIYAFSSDYVMQMWKNLFDSI